jgi:hypothetical protein
MSDHISIAVDACSKAIMSGGWSGSPTVDVGKMRRAIEAAVAAEREAWQRTLEAAVLAEARRAREFWVAAERERCAATIRRVKNDLQLPLSVSDLKILDEIGSAQQ